MAVMKFSDNLSHNGNDKLLEIQKSFCNLKEFFQEQWFSLNSFQRGEKSNISVEHCACIVFFFKLDKNLSRTFASKKNFTQEVGKNFSVDS